MFWMKCEKCGAKIKPFEPYIQISRSYKIFFALSWSHTDHKYCVKCGNELLKQPIGVEV